MGFDPQNFDISKLLGTAGNLDLGAVTSDQGPSASGLSALQDSASKGSGALGQESVKQGSPTLTPPGSGANTSYENPEVKLEEVEAILKRIPESQSFETSAAAHINNPSFKVSEELLKALNENYSEEFTLNIRLLRKLLVQMVQGFINTHPKAPQSIKGNLASLQLDVFKENFPTAEFPLSVLSKQSKNVAEQFFNDLKKQFEDQGRSFDPLGDSEFTQEAIENLSVEYLIKEGYSEEEATEMTEKNLSKVGLSKSIANWSENFTSTITPASKEQEDTFPAAMSSLEKLIQDSPLSDTNKTSILEFMAKISKALEELKNTVDEILGADFKQKKELVQQRLSTINSILALLKLSEKLDKAIENNGEVDAELAKALEMLFGVDVSQMSKEELKELLQGAAKEKVDKFERNKEQLIRELLTTIKLAIKSSIAKVKKDENTAVEAQKKSKGEGVENAFQEQIAELVKGMIEELSKMGNSGAIPQDSLSKLTHATENLIEQLKKAGLGTKGAAEIEANLEELINAKTSSTGPNAVIASDTALLLSSSVEAGQRLTSDLGNGLSPQLATAYLNDMAMNTLSLSLFISKKELGDEEIANSLGALSSKGASLGLAAGLLAAGADSSDVRALLETASGLAEGIISEDFSKYLATELIKATGQNGDHVPLMKNGIDGILGSIGITKTEEEKKEELEETQELLKTLRKAIAILEKALQGLLFGAESGSLTGTQTVKETAQAFKKAYELVMQALLPDLDKEILESILENAEQKLEGALEAGTPSAENAQLLINSMLAAGIGPANQGSGQGQMAA